jgi:adenylate cyclase
MSGDAEQEYFSEGVTEDIITNLSHNHAFFVISRSTSFTYKGPGVDVGKVGRELDVRYVLEGSVRRAGNRVRITAQLIEAATGHHLWADRCDRELADVFAVQARSPGALRARSRSALSRPRSVKHSARVRISSMPGTGPYEPIGTFVASRVRTWPKHAAC